jgi:hypothetical protein
LPPFCFTTRGRLRLQIAAKGVIRRDEEPAVATGRNDRPAGAVSDREIVEGPVHRVGRAGIPGEAHGSGRAVDHHLVRLLGDFRHRERNGRVRRVEDHVDAVAVEPLASDRRPDVRLVLVIGKDDFHFELRLRVELHVVLERHARGDDRPLSRCVGIEARLIVEHADLDGAVEPALGQRRPGR